MSAKKTFSCYLIGDDNMTLECANIILASGHELLGLISPSEKIEKWCTANCIPYIESIRQFEKKHMGGKFDFLFSIVNGEILSKEILALPRYYAINYHNSPLPKYAGLYATTWAILNGETQHAISWHIMDERIDAGNILKQPVIPIDDFDTALSLNLKCYEKAIHSFRELVDELATNTTKPVKQNLSCRSYYGLKDKPANFGFITWEKSADDIDRLCRALSMGNYLNQLVVPKIIMNGKIFVVKALKKLNSISGMEPGTIVNLSNSYLQVATATFDIAILELTDLDGENYDIPTLVYLLNITIHTKLDPIDAGLLEKLSTSPAQNPKVEKFWVNEFLKCAQEEISFLSKLPRPRESVAVFGDMKTRIPNTLLKKLKKLSSDGHSLENILLTATLIYLYRLNNYRNLSIELSPLELQSKPLFLNNFLSDHLPLSTKFDSTMAFKDVLTLVSIEKTKLLQKSTYTKEIFIRYPQLKKSSSQIDASIRFIDANTPPPWKTNKKLTIFISANHDWFHFHSNVNDESQPGSYALFENMNGHFLTLLEDLVDNPDKTIFLLSIMGKKERNNVLHAWNNTGFKYNYKKLLHQYFEEQVTKTPDSIAAVFQGTGISYHELNQKANQLACYLRSQGVRKDHLIGICLDRSIEMVVGILGILKSGGAYLPLDPNYPDERISYMLNDSQANLLIVDQQSIKKRPHRYTGKIIDINAVLDLKNLPDENLQHVSKFSNLAYVIYTSGTTGKPKGVAISHRAICNHMVWMQKEYSFSNTDVFLQKTPFSFDASVWEFFMPLFIGGKLVIAPADAHASPIQMTNLVKDNQVSVLQLVPSMLKELVSTPGFDSCHSLKQVFCGGEALLPETIGAFFKNNASGAKLHNLYGPTETTIDAITLTCTQGDAESDASRIGKPISNTKAYILDDKLQPVPIGMTGELYIAGEGLARGYLNNQEFIEQKFIANPFSNKKNDRLYKTGDLVKWQSDGIIEYIGRRDSQVKIRGFRIEVNEIESHLEKIPSIHQCIVIPEPGSDNSISLSAYVVLDQNAQLSATDIRSTLKAKIPDYMIPSRFFVVDKFLITPSGKVDRKNLPTPCKQLTSSNDYAEPNNDIELQLKNIWCSVLKIDHLGIHDDFFELGGNSLSAMNIISLIQEQFSVSLSLRNFFEFSTIHSLAKEIEMETRTADDRLTLYNPSENFIALKETGDKTPLILVHPIGGSVFWYKLLAKYLDKERPLYGIQDPGIDKNEFIFDTLEEMASAYIDSLQAIYPYGPYLLGGSSFGSTVAIEMARQLEEKGETVRAIISLDGWAFYPTLQSNELYFQDIMKEQNSRLLKKYVENNVYNSKFLLDLQWHREKMLTQYKLPIINSQLILFKAEKLTEMFQYDAPLNWWENYSKRPIELHIVPGDHESMFYEPNIQTLASKLNKSLGEKTIEPSLLNEVIGGDLLEF
ncbi:amino acid adenylation domain-containing protein [Legionella sp. 29fVS95]|uniref:amino acid adenylation domain-containing protein n=1 Tax=Legionella sp. 29fVS95 TaxID=3402813 RepID=UPI003AF49F1A